MYSTTHPCRRCNGTSFTRNYPLASPSPPPVPKMRNKRLPLVEIKSFMLVSLLTQLPKQNQKQTTNKTNPKTTTTKSLSSLFEFGQIRLFAPNFRPWVLVAHLSFLSLPVTEVLRGFGRGETGWQIRRKRHLTDGRRQGVPSVDDGEKITDLYFYIQNVGLLLRYSENQS